MPTRRGVRGFTGSAGREAAVAVEQQGVWVSRGMAWPAVGVVGGGEASAASQPATGGRSTRHDQRWFGRLQQEDQRLKKHYGRWMDIVRSLELESFVLTKVNKGPRPSQLSRPTSQPPTQVGPDSQALPCVQKCSWWVPVVRGANRFFPRNKEALPCCGRGPSCQPLHTQPTSDGVVC